MVHKNIRAGDKIVVVGGGVAGILSAILIAQKGYRVDLIEKQKDIGGLLRSIKTEWGYFDYGTHLLKETGIASLDNLLYGNIENKNLWHVLDYPKGGNYFNRLNENNGFVDLRHLGDNYSNAVVELLNSHITASDGASTLKAQLIPVYGKPIVDLVHKPTLEKFFMTPYESLAANAHLLFSLTRFIGFEKEATDMLKTIPMYNIKLAFTSFSEGLSSLRTFYPKEGGVGVWIDLLKEKMKGLKINVVTSNEVLSIEKDGREIKSVTLENGVTIPCKHLIWTIPSFFLLKAAKIKTERSFALPKRLTTYLFNYVINKKYCTDLHYLECFDPDLRTFRVTLYDNIIQKNEEQFKISVEVLSDKSEDEIKLGEKVFEELINMGLINPDSKIIFKSGNIIGGGFPVPTTQFREAVSYQNDLIFKNFDNLNLFGKGGGKKFFMSEVLSDIYKTLNETFDK